MRQEDAWARAWPNVVPSVRHVEVLALKNAWRAEALDKRFRIEAALEHHHAGDDDRCRTCKQPFPCLTWHALTTNTPWHRSVKGQPVKLPLTNDDIQAALTELLPELAPMDDAEPKPPDRKPG